MKRFRVSTLAKRDIAEIRHFIRLDKPTAADRQIAKFFDTFRILAENSELGQRRPEFGSGLRTFSIDSYTIVYRPFEKGVDIARVVSGYRDIDALFGSP